MKYICLKCKKIKKKKLFGKTFRKLLPNGKVVKVPVCCGWKMEIYKDPERKR